MTTTMTVRQLRAARRSSRRRPYVVPELAPRPEPKHAAEHRLRDAGGPEDRACYACGCGFVFQAPVSTSVRCPHCDTVQAW